MHTTHLTGDLKLIAEQISSWAQPQETIVRLWIFGSRARHTHSSESDLDVAFEIDPLPTIEDQDSFRALRAIWTTDLSAAIGLEIHFEPIAAETIQNAVTDHGALVYERSTSPPCQWLAE